MEASQSAYNSSPARIHCALLRQYRSTRQHTIPSMYLQSQATISLPARHTIYGHYLSNQQGIQYTFKPNQHTISWNYRSTSKTPFYWRFVTCILVKTRLWYVRSTLCDRMHDGWFHEIEYQKQARSVYILKFLIKHESVLCKSLILRSLNRSVTFWTYD